MNKQRRKELEKALELIAEARGIIENCRDDEQDAFDNLPESIQESERGETMEGFIDILDEAIDNLDDIETEINDEVIYG